MGKGKSIGKDINKFLKKSKIISSLGNAFAPALFGLVPESAPAITSGLSVAKKLGYGYRGRGQPFNTLAGTYQKAKPIF
jgi:hypothetical protein